MTPAAEGGFLVIPEPPLCKASDECHGPGSAAPGPPDINSVTGSGGNNLPPAASGGSSRGTAGACASATSRRATTSQARRADMAERLTNLLLSKERTTIRAKTIRSVVVFAALTLSMASPAFASEKIDSFETTSSTAQAGGHPDLHTSFLLQSPGEPEAVQNVIFNAPQGIFGNPNAITQCTPVDFSLDQCPSSSQAGLMTVYANYEGDSDYLLGTAPIYDLEPGLQTALFAFIVPTLNIPIDIPVAVRTGSDYGLRFTVQDITQLTPLARAEMTFWGFPAAPSHNAQRFPKGSAGKPAGCVGSVQHQLHHRTNRCRHLGAPAHRQPTQLQRGSADHEPQSSDLPGSRKSHRSRI